MKHRSKRVRRIEVNTYAGTARFWLGLPKTADRLGYHQPVNRQAANLLRKPKGRKSLP